MALARAKLTRQSQISVPAAVRKKLGVEPGGFIEFEEEGDKIVIRRVGRYSFDDIRKMLFPKGPPRPRTLDELKEGIAEYMRKTHGRR